MYCYKLYIQISTLNNILKPNAFMYSSRNKVSMVENI